MISDNYAAFLADSGLDRVRQMRTDLNALRGRIPDGFGRSRDPVRVSPDVVVDCSRAVNWALELCDRLLERHAIEVCKLGGNDGSGQ